MPQHKGAVRRVRLSEKRRVANKGSKVQLRKLMKEFDAKPEDLKALQSRLDKLASKGLVHKNYASNKNAQLARAVNKAKATA
jgi:small subunit ribosomal protein S20